MLTGHTNFNLIAFELSFVLDPHPGGFRYLRFNGFLMICGFLHVSVILLLRFAQTVAAVPMYSVLDVVVRSRV